ncbi:hypothetical protein TanjilG_19624 [Lupinus angustifolius]|uniref:Uncharacterized protein n=1 Tax=Lupinus angustifolius TaxID=3871 RepID=A0A1J7HEX7_LUPAN|nr:hypothetical protein TanjilG_19624 [Lupinus angustifolius]
MRYNLQRSGAGDNDNPSIFLDGSKENLANNEENTTVLANLSLKIGKQSEFLSKDGNEKEKEGHPTFLQQGNESDRKGKGLMYGLEEKLELQVGPSILLKPNAKSFFIKNMEGNNMMLEGSRIESLTENVDSQFSAHMVSSLDLGNKMKARNLNPNVIIGQPSLSDNSNILEIVLETKDDNIILPSPKSKYSKAIKKKKGKPRSKPISHMFSSFRPGVKIVRPYPKPKKGGKGKKSKKKQNSIESMAPPVSLGVEGVGDDDQMVDSSISNSITDLNVRSANLLH